MSVLAAAAEPAALTPIASRDALNVECLERIITGRSLPDGLQARLASGPCPPTAGAGIERILAGGAAA